MNTHLLFVLYHKLIIIINSNIINNMMIIDKMSMYCKRHELVE
jgi:hypothetical protein